MKTSIRLLLCVLAIPMCVMGQDHVLWTRAASSAALSRSGVSSSSEVYQLDIQALRQSLAVAPVRGQARSRVAITLNFPDEQGNLRRYQVVEASVMDPSLAARYPGIKSYAGQGIDEPGTTIRFSVSDYRGFHGMIFNGRGRVTFIDPTSDDQRTYRVYQRSAQQAARTFSCYTPEQEQAVSTRTSSSGRTDDKKLRKYRLALSCVAEYGNLFAGTTGTYREKKGRILAQMVITMTRVNGIYEKDLAVTMELVAKTDTLIYFGDTTIDPWATEYNKKTQQVNDQLIGDANYDIGHNFNTSGGGNAGCIACVCVSGSKGSGYTGQANPVGDAFDIDFVAHEMGHQFGGYHTQSNFSCRSGSGATEVEPGSGSTIMGYAGICPADIQPHSDAYFAYVNIRDISANIQTGASAGCAQIISLTNNPPTANAGADYVIPKSTAFRLRGQGSDPDPEDAANLTYCWEQNNPESPGSTNATPTPTRAAGPMFRSFEGTTSPDRNIPRIEDVVNNNLAPTWEVIPSVARTLNFSLVVRDNRAGGGQTSDDLMTVTVNATAGPFVVNGPTVPVFWLSGTTQTVSWSVAGTNAAPINCAAVNILLSTDGGYTYPITLATAVPNTGSASIVVPVVNSKMCRLKVEAADNIFYDINNVNFSISDVQPPCTAVVPTGLSVSAVTSTAATFSWGHVDFTSYNIQYKPTTGTTWTSVNVPALTNSLSVSGLQALTRYDVRVRSLCDTVASAFSATLNFTTSSALKYCVSSGNTVDEYIKKVVVGSINNASGASGGYADYTTISTDIVRQVATTITITPAWVGTVYNEAYGVWIDLNADGDFGDAGEMVFSKTITKATSVTGTITLPSTAKLGLTRMRVSMKYSGIPAACGVFPYGEVEDYTVNIVATAPAVAPAARGGNIIEQAIQTSVYPNPVKDRLYIEVPAGTTVRAVQVLSTSGHVLFRADQALTEIDVRDYRSGMYVLTLHTTQGVINKKFVKE